MIEFCTFLTSKLSPYGTGNDQRGFNEFDGIIAIMCEFRVIKDVVL